ncbi:glycosyltransferase family 2 protein [Acerihabitans arboris]|uniref:Glycosyltransferase n=1 Tax=Acerihabitans arboris TaxID=2691583 RepID=A0A845SHB1_9GAMM|nr:glycosyltransferase family 2 protein [Acerihabitans arboris]NDL62324.1 glycosyltransferase [Acerihabitans arboris]
MKIFAICMVKDEVDILQRSLESALKWADKIVLIDHNSTDGTWELINEKFRYWDKIEVFGQVTDDFQDGLRSRAYNKYKNLIEEGDWLCRLDSDEFYIDSPRDFLAKVDKYYDVVHCASFQYYFTESDVVAYNNNPDLYKNGACVDTLKYFACNSSEARFVRNRNTKWNDFMLWPQARFPHLIWKNHIRLKHFQYRYPEQIQHRLDLRSAKVAGNQFSHEIRDDWNQRIDSRQRINRAQSRNRTNQHWDERIVNSSKLLFDDGMNGYIVNTDLLDPIRGTFQQVARNCIKVILRRQL